ncbi:S-layer protein [Secundilactobacillus malefermentans]|uniref:S-layer protein n=1 Tax=Secundilactobacillus malefermentans TaxID=176292 RepID=UPI0011CB1886|nr:S-layer protein [Secundilactobacillus malefermentans]QEA31799.1 S-layer protein [Secundilactobacillus malefermentans]
MNSSLKKSLYLGLAAVSFIAAAGAATTNASAKTYAKISSYPALSAKAADRNVALNGTNAIYTKAGTLKGAKVVASKTTVKNLMKSTSSKKNFRVYKAAVTNRGSVYYKVVSFDKAYRGWIYGGKTANTFAGGIKSYDTFTAGTLTTEQKDNTFTIANPGTANDNKTVTYKAPAWTQYKVGRQITDSTSYASAKFNITQVGTRTKEGDTWVYVTAADSANSAANGWILYSGLKSSGVTAAEGVTVNYLNKATGQQVGTKIIAVPADKTLDKDDVNGYVPAGYSYDSIGKTAVTAGSTSVAYVNANAPLTTASVTAANVAGGSSVAGPTFTTDQNTKVNDAVKALNILSGQTVTVAQQQSILSTAGVSSFNSADGKTHYELVTSSLSDVKTPAETGTAAALTINAKYTVTTN